MFLVFSLVVLLLLLGWSGCCQICHLYLFSLHHRRVFLITLFSLVVLLLLLGWSGCCQICHLYLFSLHHRRVFLIMHVSRTCSCVFMVSVHLRHLVSLYFPLKLFFTSCILVVALKMVDASIIFNYFVYFGRAPAFKFVCSRRNCIFVFSPLGFSMLCRKYLFSCCGLIYSFWVLCRVSLICSLILVVVSFHHPAVFGSMILVVIFVGVYVVFFLC